MSDTTFEIGLVGAGAISAGAYTAGVIDFLVQALDELYEAKEKDPVAPPHDVKLSVFSGASAGAMTAALATAYLGSAQPPVTNEMEAVANKGKNNLFDAWVERIDISTLLDTRDLQGKDGVVRSLLDSSALASIADAGIRISAPLKKRAFVADNFELLLTVTNLRGVPYSFEVIGDQARNYDMTQHADYLHFQISDKGGSAPPDRYPMSWEEFSSSTPILEKLRVAALASGAFPIGLAPRDLSHIIPGSGATDCYSARQWPIPTPSSANPHQCVTPQSIPASWGKLSPNFQFDFQCVDGGVINNEPLELARRLLAGSAPRNPRDGLSADKAILLIDPFPDYAPFDPQYAAAPDLAKTGICLLTALINQARFKPDELMLAAREDVYSRFMIAPSRDGQTYAVASGALCGFGGFLKREFRAHDFFLGRRNAQKFCRDHFVLPENNPLFSKWSDPKLKEAHYVRDAGGNPKVRGDQRLLPIIPLTRKAKTPCYQAPWPQFSADDMERLRSRIEGRVDVVVDHLVGQYFSGHNPLVRFVAGLVLGLKKRDLTRYARQRIGAELVKMKLMRP